MKIINIGTVKIINTVATLLLLIFLIPAAILLTLAGLPASYAAYRRARAEGSFHGSFGEWLDSALCDC